MYIIENMCEKFIMYSNLFLYIISFIIQNYFCFIDVSNEGKRDQN